MITVPYAVCCFYFYFCFYWPRSIVLPNDIFPVAGAPQSHSTTSVSRAFHASIVSSSPSLKFIARLTFRLTAFTTLSPRSTAVRLPAK